MGGAMLKGWLSAKNTRQEIIVVEPNNNNSAPFQNVKSVRIVDDADLIDRTLVPTAIIIAVKPQIINKIIEKFKRFTDLDCLFLSIMAGKTVSYLEQTLGASPIVRTMPNTPASVGRGITVAYANEYTSMNQKNLSAELLGPLGKLRWTNMEASLDAVTALTLLI